MHANKHITNVTVEYFCSTYKTSKLKYVLLMLKVTLPNAHVVTKACPIMLLPVHINLARLRELTFLRNLDLTLGDFHTEKPEMRLQFRAQEMDFVTVAEVRHLLERFSNTLNKGGLFCSSMEEHLLNAGDLRVKLHYI